ncbi:unnamed protein product [Prunus brigantina]
MREMDEIRSTYVSPYGTSGDRSFDNEGYAWESKKNSSRKSSSIYSFSQSELKRQRRVAKYKSYVVEAKFKSALKNGVRWFKNNCAGHVTEHTFPTCTAPNTERLCLADPAHCFILQREFGSGAQIVVLHASFT